LSPWVSITAFGIVIVGLTVVFFVADKKCPSCKVDYLESKIERAKKLCHYCIKRQEQMVIRRATNIIRKYKRDNKII